MCRWLAYSGPPIYLDSLILRPEHSLIAQSRRAFMSASVTNGDGFGIGWYGERPEPGLFRDTRPAWNDDNLKSVSEQIRARLFFAHVCASTGTATTRDNCHRFRHGPWLFMHNGLIGGLSRSGARWHWPSSRRSTPVSRGRPTARRSSISCSATGSRMTRARPSSRPSPRSGTSLRRLGSARPSRWPPW